VDRRPAVQKLIANRLGWVGAVDFVESHRARLDALAESVRRDGFTDVVLMGMGGSSLAPEVLRQVLGVAPGCRVCRCSIRSIPMRCVPR
jgi:glucose-6-phosphate isomerase